MSLRRPSLQRYQRTAAISGPDELVYIGPWGGIVTGVEDGKHRGVIQVRVPGLTGTGSVDAEPMGNFRGGTADGAKWGGGIIPPVGSFVRVEFENGDPSYPRWSLGAPPDGELPDDLVTNYPKRCIGSLVTPSGHKLILDDSDGNAGDVFLQQRDGGQLKLGGDGNVDLDSKAGGVVNVNGSGHPLPLWDTFLGDFATFLGDLLAGTVGGPTKQQPVNAASIATFLTKVKAAMAANVYASKAANNG